MIHQHTNLLYLSINITRFFLMQNKSRIEKMTYCLHVYDPDIIILSINIFIDSTHFKILSIRNVASMNKISITGSLNVLLLDHKTTNV